MKIELPLSQVDQAKRQGKSKPVKLATILLMLFTYKQPTTTKGFTPRLTSHRGLRDSTTCLKMQFSDSGDFRAIDRKYGLIAKEWVKKLATELDKFNNENLSKPDVTLVWDDEHGSGELVLKGSRYHEPASLRFLVKNLTTIYGNFFSKNPEDYTLELSNKPNLDNDYYIDFVHICDDQVYANEKRKANFNQDKLRIEGIFNQSQSDQNMTDDFSDGFQ